MDLVESEIRALETTAYQTFQTVYQHRSDQHPTAAIRSLLNISEEEHANCVNNARNQIIRNEELHNLEIIAYDAILKVLEVRENTSRWETRAEIAQLRLQLTTVEHLESVNRVRANLDVFGIKERRANARSELPSKRPRRAVSKYQSSGSTTRGSGIDDDDDVPVKRDPFLGRQLRLKWTDGKIYDAVITDYNPKSAEPFCLLYDVGQADESFGWISLKDQDINVMAWIDDKPPPVIP